MYLFCLCFVRAITCYTRVYVRGWNSVSIFTSRLTNTQHNTQHITWCNVWSELPNFIDLIELFECAVFHFDFCVNQTVLAWSWNNTCDMLETTAISRGATTGNNCRIIALLPAITITSRRQLTWGPQHRISSTSVLYATTSFSLSSFSSSSLLSIPSLSVTAQAYRSESFHPHICAGLLVLDLCE